jgi:hypothetical protein
MDKLFNCPHCKEKDCIKRIPFNLKRVKVEKTKKVTPSKIENVIESVSNSLSKDNLTNIDTSMKFSNNKIIGVSQTIEKKLTTIKPQYKYIRPITFTKTLPPSKTFILEPYIPDSKRILIIKKDGEVKIHITEKKLLEPTSYIDRIKMISEPTNFVCEAYLAKNGAIILTDIIEKDDCSLKNEPLEVRKEVLIQSKIANEANISFIKFYYAKNKEEMLNKVMEWKSKGIITILKSASSTYNASAGWMKLNFTPPLKLDLGCGERKIKGYFGIDKNKHTGVDKVYNLEKGIPLEDDSCKVVNAHHFMQYHSNPQFMMEEIYRVLKHGGEAIITVPKQVNQLHKSHWNEFAIHYYTDPYLIKKFQTNCYFKIKKAIQRTSITKKVYLTWILEAVKDA